MKQHIADKLEQAFSKLGFAEPSVAKLKDECEVSLRTLYKHYPSKEEMIVAALSNRHYRYLEFIEEGISENGSVAVSHIFEKLEIWMRTYAPNGCMSVSALNAFPANKVIHEAVTNHKAEVLNVFTKHIGCKQLATQLFLLHEGVSSAWPSLGDATLVSAKLVISTLFDGRKL